MAEPTGAAIVEAKFVEWLRWASREAVDVPEALKNHIRDLCDSHEALLAALPQWRPISEAKRDGSCILVNAPYGLDIARWVNESPAARTPSGWRYRRSHAKSYDADHQPTHFLLELSALPPAPTPEKPS